MILKKQKSPRYIRDEGIISYLVASPRTCGAKHLTVTLVEISPSGEQRVHRHAPEQIYFIVEGSGLMTVGEEEERVEAGDCVFIPPDARHGLRNDSQRMLRYVSATAPPFTMEELREFWPLAGEDDS
jgi:mannose-6-phosphate isomerase-like protein (cupin superfamily)